MKATHNTEAFKGININHRKENRYTGGYIAIAIVGGKAKEVVDLRTYSTDSTAYVCIWTSLSNTNYHGSGKASGYGYHRGSSAAAEAIRNAGWKLDEDIDGRGESAMREAVESIARTAYPNAELIHIVCAHA